MEIELSEQKAEEYIKETYKRSWEDYRLTSQRFDYLLITVDGAGVYLCLELIKFFLEKGLCISTSLKLAGIFFAVSIIFNFLSQFCGFNVHHNVLKIEQTVALDKPGGIELFKKKIKIYYFFNASFMWISMLLMIVAFIVLTNLLYTSF